MTSKPVYYPILKGKAGEFAALEQIREAKAEQRPKFTPIFDVPPEKVKFWSEKGERSFQIQEVGEALDGYAAKVAKAWPAVEQCFVDLAGFDPDARLPNGMHPVSRFFADATELSAIPVTGPDRDDPQLKSVKAECGRMRLGCAIRIRRRQLARPAELAGRIRGLLDYLELSPAEVDLLLDFGELTPSLQAGTEQLARRAIAALPEIDAWRRLILSAGAFPYELGVVDAEETKELPRLEWSLWGQVRAAGAASRLPSYGDYAATYAEWKGPFNPTEMSIAAKIVYATSSDWVVAKGREVNSENGAQYPTLSKRVSEHPAFLGRRHCPTEARILECMVNPERPGNNKQWLTAAIRHHIEIVSRQLASFAAP